MEFGSSVIVVRGSSGISSGNPGSLREVRGILIGARGHERTVRLTEDDPLSTIPEWSKAGEVGRWSASQVQRAEWRSLVFGSVGWRSMWARTFRKIAQRLYEEDACSL